MLNKHDYDILSSAIEQAQKSPVLMRHGCIAARHGKLLAKGFNHYRTYSKCGIIKNTCTCHAECHVVHQLNNLGITDFKKIKLYIVRINRRNDLRSSAPCVDCYNLLVKVGVKTIIYSTGNGFQKTKLADFTPTQITKGRQFLNGDFD